MIPLATTTISVLRLTAAQLADPYDNESVDSGPASGFNVVQTGIRAHISAPSGREQVAGGEQADVAFKLAADPCDLDHADRVKDESTGHVFLVDWAFLRTAMGLDHVTAQLRRVSGL